MAKRGKLINTVASLNLQPRGVARPKPQTGFGGAMAPRPNPAPQVAPAATAPPAAPAAQPSVFTPDAEYLARIAQSQFQRQNQLNELDTQSRVQKEDTAEAIRRLLAKVPDDRRGITAGANRQGLLFGGHHAKQLDDYQGQVQRAESDQRLALQRAEDERAAIRKALQEGASLEEAAERAAAVERQIARDQEAAALNMLAAPPTAAGGASAAVAARPAASERARFESSQQRGRAAATAAEAEARARARRRKRR